MPIIYTVFNHETKTESVVTEEQLENLYPELKSGICEVTDEIDTDAVSFKDIIYTELAVILETIQDIGDDDICKRLSDSVKVIDSALKCVES